MVPLSRREYASTAAPGNCQLDSCNIPVEKLTRQIAICHNQLYILLSAQNPLACASSATIVQRHLVESLPCSKHPLTPWPLCFSLLLFLVLLKSLKQVKPQSFVAYSEQKAPVLWLRSRLCKKSGKLGESGESSGEIERLKVDVEICFDSDGLGWRNVMFSKDEFRDVKLRGKVAYVMP